MYKYKNKEEKVTVFSTIIEANISRLLIEVRENEKENVENKPSIDYTTTAIIHAACDLGIFE